MCIGIYSEPETEEHKNGKIALYKWALTQDELTDVVLEGWIPGTRQRPDLMFKYMDTQYVIEFQCSPICTEFHERHELYQAGGVIDIWITGTEKYNFKSYRRRGFTIEQFSTAFFDVSSGALTFFPQHMQKLFHAAGKHAISLPNVYLLADCKFNDGLIGVLPFQVGSKLSRAIKKNEREEAALATAKKNAETILETLAEAKGKYGFVIAEKRSQRYIAKIEFDHLKAAFFKKDKVDFCEKEIRWSWDGKDRFGYSTIKTIEFDRIIERVEIISAIEQFKALMMGGV